MKEQVSLVGPIFVMNASYFIVRGWSHPRCFASRMLASLAPNPPRPALALTWQHLPFSLSQFHLLDYMRPPGPQCHHSIHSIGTHEKAILHWTPPASVPLEPLRDCFSSHSTAIRRLPRMTASRDFCSPSPLRHHPLLPLFLDLHFIGSLDTRRSPVHTTSLPHKSKRPASSHHVSSPPSARMVHTINPTRSSTCW
jgi:hypothetical protein